MTSSQPAGNPSPAPHRADVSAEAFRARYEPHMAYLTERLGVPAPDGIYTPDEERLAIRPRLHFGGMSVSDLQRRAADPRFADVVAHVHAFAARFAGSLPPATVQLGDHDPNRAFGDALAWMAMSVLIDPDPARGHRTLEGLLRWVRAMRAWGPFQINLPLAQATMGLSIVYDWLHDRLPADERAAIRAQIITNARLALDETQGGLTMWRGQRFAANHNWAHHGGRAFAALTLWGEDDPALAPGELRAWLDDALVDFWIVKHTHSNDGAPMEGPCYQDYGLRLFLDFAVQSESLLKMREPLLDEHIRALSARVFTVLPGNRTSMVYADGMSDEWWGSCSNFRILASHFRDERLQLMGDIMANCGDIRARPSWRDLFAYDPELAAARQEDLPLACDMTDFGLYTARSDWGEDAAFFGLRCGPASATSAAEKFGYDFGEGHVYPNQGDFTFFVWGRPVTSPCEYPSLKVTSNHSLALFEGRAAQAGRAVGQLGEGGPWFNALVPTDPDADYENRARPARVVEARHGDGFHHYLCDLGGLYRVLDERVPGGFFFADYWRSLVFLPDGAVAIVDRLTAPVERTITFRLLLTAEDLRADDRGFGFSHRGDRTPARIDDYSPVAFARHAGHEELTTMVNKRPAVASLRAENVREAVFAVILGVGPAAFRYRLATDADGYAVLAGEQTLLRVEWPAAS